MLEDFARFGILVWFVLAVPLILLLVFFADFRARRGWWSKGKYVLQAAALAVVLILGLVYAFSRDPRREAIEEHWEQIRFHLSGTEEVEACDLTGGGCYVLQADIIRGRLTAVHFSNGGSIGFSTPMVIVGDTAYALDTDAKGREWEVFLDMQSPTVETAFREWARLNNWRP